MKFCYECGYKLEGHEKVCSECGTELNPENTKHFSELILNQFLDDVGAIKDDACDILENMEISDVIDDFYINSKKALNRDADYVKRARKKLETYGDDNRIVYLCNKALLVNDKNWEAYYIKGRALINLGRYNEAIDQLLNCLALNKDFLEAREYIAKAAHLKLDLDYAISVFDSILNIDENYYEAIKGKALVYFDKKDYSKADKFFKKANNIFPLTRHEKYKWEYCQKKLKEE